MRGTTKTLAVGLAGLAAAVAGMAAAAADETPARAASADGTALSVTDEAVTFTLPAGRYPYILCQAKDAALDTWLDGPAGSGRLRQCPVEGRTGPDGTVITDTGYGPPVGGAYTLRFPRGGSATVRVFGRPEDVRRTVALDGEPITVNTETGQDVEVSVDATAGDRIYPTCSYPKWWLASGTLWSPEGRAVTGAACAFDQPLPAGFRTWTATRPGRHVRAVDRQEDAAGPVTVALHRVPADVTGTAVVDGSAQLVTITAPGQGADITFHARTGQQVTADVTTDLESSLVYPTFHDTDGQIWPSATAPPRTVTVRRTGMQRLHLDFTGRTGTATVRLRTS